MILSCLTINLKVDLPLTRQFLKWKNRRDAVNACIQSLNPDIIFAQEMSDDIYIDIQHDFAKKYTILKANRSDKEKNGESLAVLLKKSVFSDVEIKTIWLSKTPSVSSKLKTSLKPRIATVISSKINSHTLLFVNTHLDPLFPWVRNQQMAYLSQYINLHQVAILGGDFNGNYSERWFRSVSQIMRYVKPDNDHNTLHYGNGKIKLATKAIDYLFVNPNLKVIGANIIDHPYNGVYPSDHFPIYLKVELRM